MSKAKAKTEELGNLSREELLERARNLYGEVWKPERFAAFSGKQD